MKKGVDYIGVGVGAAIEHKGTYLLGKRGPNARNEAGKWEFPGGAVEFGDTVQDTIVREVKEEHDIEIEVVQLLGVADHILEKEGQHWVSPTFLCRLISGDAKIMEPDKCEKIGWFTIDEIGTLDLSIATQFDLAKLIEAKSGAS